MANIVIAGCGDVGCELGRRLARAGHEVWGVRRCAGAIPRPIRALGVDLNDLEALRAALPARVDYACYAASADKYEEAAYQQAYVEGLANFVAALREREGCRRLVFTSSTSVYAQSDGEWVDESSATEPTGFSGRCMLAGERLVRASAIGATVVRFGGIYGPGRERLLNRVRGAKPCVDEPPQYTNRIHRDDCAGVLQHLLEHRDPAELYLAVDSDPASQCVVMTWLAERLGLPPPARVVAGEEEAVRGNKRCSNRRLLASGYRFEYPSFREGYGAMLPPRPAP